MDASDIVLRKKSTVFHTLTAFSRKQHSDSNAWDTCNTPLFLFKFLSFIYICLNHD